MSSVNKTGGPSPTSVVQPVGKAGEQKGESAPDRRPDDSSDQQDKVTLSQEAQDALKNNK